MRFTRWLLLICAAGLLAAPLLAQEPALTPTDDTNGAPLPLTEAVYGSSTGVYVRYPDGWRAFESFGPGMLYVATSFDIYDDDTQIDPNQAFMAIRVRRYADTPRIPPNEDSLAGTGRLVPGTPSREAYTVAPLDLVRYRGGTLTAPFLPNTARYLLFLDQERYAEVLVGTAPGAFDAFAPTFTRILETVTLLDEPPGDTRRAFTGELYVPRGNSGGGLNPYDFSTGNLEVSVPRAWALTEIDAETFVITNSDVAQRETPFLFPGEFVAVANYRPIPQDAVQNPVSLLYDALPGAAERMLHVDTTTWNGVEIARAVLNDGTIILTRLILEPPRDDDQPRQLTHDLTLVITYAPTGWNRFEGTLYDVLVSAQRVNEPFFRLETRQYADLTPARLEALAPSPYVSARADLATAYPAGWYLTSTPNAVIARSSNRPFDPTRTIFDQRNDDEAIVRLSIGFYNNPETGLSPDLRLAEQTLIIAQLDGTPVDRITVTTFGEREAATYQANFNTFVVIMPLDDERYLRADVAADGVAYSEFYERRVLAMLAQTQRVTLGSDAGGGVPTLDTVFSAPGQRVRFVVPKNWYTGQSEATARSAALIAIPKDGSQPLRGDIASPAFQGATAALMTITYQEPPTFTFIDDEGEGQTVSQSLFDYLQATIGPSDALTEQITVAGFPALRRLENGTGHILVQRGDGSVVQVYVQNLTGTPTNRDYSFDYEPALYAVLDTLSTPPADATRPTEPYSNRALGFSVLYPYGWTVTTQDFAFVQGEGDEQETLTETVVRFSNVPEFTGGPGEARLTVQIEGGQPRRDFRPGAGARVFGQVELTGAVDGITAVGTVYANEVIFTAQATSPFRVVVVELETTPADLETFYPTGVGLLQSLDLRTPVLPEPEAEGEAAADGTD